MQREKVASKLLASIGYDAQSQVLEVEFVSGKVYRYFGIEPQVMHDMNIAKSTGGYFLKNIVQKGKYEHRIVEENEAPEVTIE